MSPLESPAIQNAVDMHETGPRKPLFGTAETFHEPSTLGVEEVATTPTDEPSSATPSPSATQNLKVGHEICCRSTFGRKATRRTLSVAGSTLYSVLGGAGKQNWPCVGVVAHDSERPIRVHCVSRTHDRPDRDVADAPKATGTNFHAAAGPVGSCDTSNPLPLLPLLIMAQNETDAHERPPTTNSPGTATRFHAPASPLGLVVARTLPS
jgi:hypothetical protein